MTKNKTIIIGIDGVPYKLMDNLSKKGIMPNFNNLKNQGIFTKMHSSVPHISSVSWSSIITGKNPGEHGIFGFTEIIPGTYSLSFPDFNSLKSPTFWQKNNKQKYIILNVPSTYPAKEINGVHISGFVSLDLEKSVFPKEYLPKLKQLNYKVDVDSSLAHKSKTLFLENLFEVLEARIKTYKYFWQEKDWDTFMLVFTGSDRLEHFLWNAYENENHKYHQDFLKYFKRIDEVIGEIANSIKKNDSLLMMSDHGMEKIKNNFYVNQFLKQKGFLSLDESQKNYNQITEETTAFALDPGRIYLNKKSKYPKGKIKKEQENKIINDLISAFSEIEKDGQKIIKKTHKKEEIYQGKEIARAPDLVLIENSGFRLRGNINKNVLFEQDVFGGKHTPDDAFLFVKKEGIGQTISKKPRVEDLTSIMVN